MSKATLLVIQGVDQGARFEVGEQPVGIGRGVRNDIRIIDTEVSRQHATIQFENGNFLLSDRNSSNGTFVNGIPVRTRVLNNGDQIQIGRSVVLFNQLADDESKYAAEKVDFVARHDPSDRSSIVEQIGHEDGDSILAQRGTAGNQTVANLQTLYRISEEAVRPSISIDQLLKRILDLTIEAIGADRGCILLSEPDKEELVPQSFSVRRGTDSSVRMPVSRTIVDYVLKHGQGVRTSDARTDHRFDPGQSIVQAGIREAMCVPMQGRFELLGVIYLDITTPPEQFLTEESSRERLSEEQLRLLVAIGRQSALAIENNRYQDALLKAERLATMGQTIAMLSHHIKNILQGVRGGSYLIDMGLNDHNEELVRKGWNIVEKNQGKIYHLVLDMLTFSKERQPALEQAELNETVSEVCELMQARAEECQVRFQLQLQPDIPGTIFDPEGIHRAVLNIVTNAIDAVEGLENGMVCVQTGYVAETDMVFIAVTDNGPGIPDEQRAKIFNIFESTKGARGTGLGLAVSQKIVHEHGGQISVESKPGEGSRFVLTWPRIDDEHHRPLESHTSS